MFPQFYSLDRRKVLMAGVGFAAGAVPWCMALSRSRRIQILEQPLVFEARPIRNSHAAAELSVLDLDFVRRRLRWRPQMTFSDLLHWLRVFGIPNSPEYREELSRNTLELLTDERRISERFGQAGVIVASQNGVRFLSRRSGIDLKDKSRPAHPYQELAVFGELGLPSSTRIFTSESQFTLKDAILDCLSNLQIREAQSQEPEWATQAIAHYLPPARSWENRWAETITLDQWADFLIERDIKRFSCGGTHLLHALALLLQANARYGVLHQRCAERVSEICGNLSREIELSQHDDGAWRADWSNRGLGQTYEGVDVHLTGHVLEAQLYLPDALRISKRCAGPALRFLSNAFRVANDATVAAEYCFYSHAGNVLLRSANERSFASNAGDTAA